MPNDLVLIDDAAGVRTLTLNRPERRNALNVALLIALREAIGAAAADDDVRALVVTGAGKGFCAGADIAEWSEAVERGDDETGAAWERNAHALMQELHDLATPTVAVLNGAAVGAGLDLACCCDFRIASSEAFFVCSYTRVGYPPDAGGTWLYPRLLGLEQAKRFVFTAERWSAAEALQRGLVTEIAEPDRLGEAGAAFARQLAAGPTVALRLAKRLLHDSAGRTLAEQLAAEKAAGAICAETADHREALAAAVERRDPVFRGQ